MKYISPKLNGFSEAFQLIHYTQRDINEIYQTQFIEDDLLWRVLVNGDLEDYKLIKKNLENSDNKLLKVKCTSGFQPQKNMNNIGGNDFRFLVEPNIISCFKLTSEPKIFDWNQKLRRNNEKAFYGERIVFPKRPLKSFNFRMNAIRLYNEKYIHKENITSFRLYNKESSVSNYGPYLAIATSKLLGYHLYQTAPQWDKGEEKRESIRNGDVALLPFIDIENQDMREVLNNLVELIEKTNDISIIEKNKSKIDEIVFNLYNLTEYQKEIIREFFQVRVERVRHKMVRPQDIEKYIEAFVSSFNLMLKKGKKLFGQYKISANVGAVACFTIVDESFTDKPKEALNLDILHFVKKKQICDAERSKILNEDKVKIYDNEFMYIIKSNQFKDWTVRQAMRDAREEIGLLLSKLPDNHE